MTAPNSTIKTVDRAHPSIARPRTVPAGIDRMHRVRLSSLLGTHSATRSADDLERAGGEPGLIEPEAEARCVGHHEGSRRGVYPRDLLKQRECPRHVFHLEPVGRCGERVSQHLGHGGLLRGGRCSGMCCYTSWDMPITIIAPISEELAASPERSTSAGKATPCTKSAGFRFASIQGSSR